jgi:ribosome-binding protein aMBF1 (putative translation factor)
MSKRKRIPASQTHKEMVEEWKADPAFKVEYDALEEEYQLLHDMLNARKRSGLNQADVAERMGTKASAISRLEAAMSRPKHSPSLSTLHKYARAINHKIKWQFVPIKEKPNKHT